MSDKEGTLRMQPSGRWAVCRPGHDPVEITSGEVFRIEVPGKEGLQLTRMEFRHRTSVSPAELPLGYYSVDRYPLRDGLRAAIGSGE
jgi:hypothetical protein